ncbi:hypothetical protein C0995_003347, partial [Termitomyces sp. Mi166
VAAGNNGAEASLFSPAHVSDAITVAASDITDYETSWSNYGDAIDIFAGGEDIVSTGIDNTTVSLISSMF